MLRLVAKYFESIGVYFVVIHISVELDLHVNHVKISEKWHEFASRSASKIILMHLETFRSKAVCLTKLK